MPYRCIGCAGDVEAHLVNRLSLLSQKRTGTKQVRSRAIGDLCGECQQKLAGAPVGALVQAISRVIVDEHRKAARQEKMEV